MVGVTVGAILIGTAAVLLAATLRMSSQNKFLQAASFLSQDLMEKVTVYAERQWYCGTGCSGYGIANLTANAHYYLSQTAPSPFTASAGDEFPLTIEGVAYTRYFYVEDVVRDQCGTGTIVSNPVTLCTSAQTGNDVDPSTKRVTVVTSWPSGGTVTLVRYLTRSRNVVTIQTDWSGGRTTPTFEVISAISTTNRFYDDAPPDHNIDFTSIPGSITIKPQ